MQIEPETVSIGTSSMIIIEVVVRVSDPEAGWSLIRVEQAHTSLSVYDEIVRNVVLCLDGILYENSMALDVVSNIILQS